MEKIKMLLAHRFFKILKWVFLILIGLYIIAVFIRVPFKLREEKTVEQVAKIHATKLTLDDVMGKNLPPDPGAEADKTVAGIDANNNGIRDDVELAVFREYPKSAKTRAVLLQYALQLQMELTQKIMNKDIAVELVMESDRAESCIADVLVPRKSPESARTNIDIEKIDSFINFIEKKQLNTDARKKEDKNFYSNLSGIITESENEKCDVSSLILPN